MSISIVALPPRTSGLKFVGGHPALDFANTVSGRARGTPLDHLGDYDAFRAWTKGAGLQRRFGPFPVAGTRGREAARLMARVRDVRELLYRLLSSSAGGVPPDPQVLKGFSEALRHATRHMRLTPHRRAPMTWSVDPRAGLVAPLAAVVWSAAELLASDDARLVRECRSATCSWLFLDTTRNRSRRWCEARVCGNRQRVREHYRRQRKRNRPALGSPTSEAR